MGICPREQENPSYRLHRDKGIQPRGLGQGWRVQGKQVAWLGCLDSCGGSVGAVWGRAVWGGGGTVSRQSAGQGVGLQWTMNVVFAKEQKQRAYKYRSSCDTPPS